MNAIEAARVDSPQYRQDYMRGWKSKGSLDVADRNGNSANTAWMDGRGDAAAGRPKWHRLECANHSTCEWR